MTTKNKTTKWLKIVAAIFFFMLIGVPVALGTYKQSTSSQACVKCHMMIPETMTWRASSHSQVECVVCHVQPGTLNLMKHNLKMVKRSLSAITDSYQAPIIMTETVSNQACVQCHNMVNREVTPSGDLIIPHDAHQKRGVSCAKCHTGVAHGNISSRKVTYKSDYSKWTEELGQSLMSDTKATRPKMDTCMRCHKVKKAPLKCAACHTTSMFPASHKEKQFFNGGHGKIDSQELNYCDSCHGYMSEQTVEGLKQKQTYMDFLDKGKGVQTVVSVQSYAKQNTFCKDCHGKRPPSHKEELFLMNHGLLAEGRSGRCITCHDNNGNGSVTKISCSSCHPGPHSSGWQARHAIELPPKPKVTAMCFTCHIKDVCSRCHSVQK